MQQVYLLLRNNQQKGPFTLEQLLAQQLKPFDLVWVEGRSAAWQYPGEVPSLKPYVPAPPQSDQPYMPLPTAVLDGMEAQTPVQPQFQPQPAQQVPQQAAAPKNIFVSMPRSAAASTSYTAPKPEPVAAPVPQPLASPNYQSYTPPPVVPQPVTPTSAQPVGETKYTRSLDEAEEAYTSWIYNQKTKKKKSLSTKDLGVAAVLVLLIGGGIWLLSQPSVTATHLPAAQPAVTATPEPTATTTTEETTAPQPQTETAINTSSQTAALPASVENKAPIKEKPKKTVTSSPLPIAENSTAPISATAEKPRVKETVSEPVAVNTAPTPAPEETASPKKKKLRDVFKNMFSKKDKTSPTDNIPTNTNTAPPKSRPVQQEEPRPATNRQTARRGDGNGETAAPSSSSPSSESATPISELVDVSSNAPDSWMMGVTGLKVTVRNRSGAVLQNASVDVLYYDQNNKLLDKKTLYFNGVPSRGKQTQAAPDHKWADHVDLKLGTVTAKDDRYAGAK